MDLEIVGRHALFFDDDAMATFVNSPTALVDWNSLFIDRYDVRHLLSSPPPPRLKRRRPISDDLDLEPELDHERYFDLPADSPSPSHDENDINDVSANTKVDGFRAVPFSYGSTSDFSDQINADMESGFHPPFPVPDCLLQNLPPTEKLHQIIARTSSFVSKHGGQSEIVLRVKQGGNPTFGFLMPDHRLHPYFRFLVEHQELLTGKSSVEDKKIEGGKDGGALSLLGLVYGTVDDEDTIEESAKESKTNELAVGDDGVLVADSNGPDGSKRAANNTMERDVASKSSLTSNDKAYLVRRNPSVSSVDVVERKQINGEDDDTKELLTSDKLQSSAMPAQSKLEPQIVEPPIEMKKVIDKIVDFIQKNGKELEPTLASQDVKYGMFPFLRPANLYHAYYRKVLQEAEELKSCDKGDITKKKDMKQEKMGTAVKDDKPAFGSVLPDDFAKKEKLKMVSDKPKIELHTEPFKPVEPQMRINVDVNTAAAILEAARRGIRNPQLGILSGKPLDETSQSLGNDGSNTSSKSSDLAKSTGQLISGSAAASEADSSEAGLSKEQKLKAERLKRAKMFMAMLKPGAQSAQQAEPLRSLSVEPLDSGISRLGSNAAKEREGSSIPSEAETKQADDGNSEKRSKRNYRSRSQRDGDYEMEEDDEESSMEEGTEETKTEKKHSSKKQHDRHKHMTRHSSKDRHSRDKHKHESSSDDEYHSLSRHRHKHRKSSDRRELYDSSDNEREHRHRSNKHSKDVGYSKDKRSHHHRSRKHDKHFDSSDDEHHRHHRHRSSRRKHEDSSDSEPGHRHKSGKRMKKDKKTEEEETVSKTDLKAAPEDSIISNPQNEPTQVSDELRAKIRAMLADTL